MGWITTTLIVLPLGVGLLLAVLPFPRAVAGLLALATAALEIAFWAVGFAHFSFVSADVQPLQLENRQTWFKDLGVSYHTAFTSWSVWLIGLSAIVIAAAIAYGWWVGRERARVYFAMMLFLLGGVVGVFTAQDLLLFYVFWELMLIPLYILVGVWGGPNRLRATITFVIYTMAGSLLFLAAIVAFGLKHGTFDFFGADGYVQDSSGWMFLAFMAAFVVKAPLFPFHAWVPLTYREAPAEVSGVLSGVISKAATYAFFYVVILRFPIQASDYRTPILVLASIGLIYGSILAFRAPDIRGVIAYSSLAQMSLITLGIFASNLAGWNGAWLQMVNHGLISAALFMLAGIVERTTGTGRLERLGGMAKGRPALATVLMAVGVIALAVPGSTAFAGEYMILQGVFTSGWGWAVVGAIAIVLAAMYVLRMVSAILHRRKGASVPEQTHDLHYAELSIVVPLVAILLFLSAWPAFVTDRSFTLFNTDGNGNSVPALLDFLNP